MAKFDNPLNNLKVASPCPANWDSMYGDQKKRFCGDCKLNVYNLSGMTKTEAEDLLRNTEGRLCVRYFQRADGTVLTRDCPVGWRAFKKRVSNLTAAAFTLVLGFFGLFAFAAGTNKNESNLVAKLISYATPTPPPTPSGRYLMGDMAAPSPTPKATPKATPEPEGRFIMGGKAAPTPAPKKTMGTVKID